MRRNNLKTKFVLQNGNMEVELRMGPLIEKRCQRGGSDSSESSMTDHQQNLKDELSENILNTIQGL